MLDSRNGIQIGLTAILAWLAICFDLSPSLFAADDSFAYMASVGNEHSWSVAFLIAANVGLLGLMTTRRSFRLLSVLLVATAHGIVAGCLLLAAANVWSGTYVLVALMGYYLAFTFVHAATR